MGQWMVDTFGEGGARAAQFIFALIVVLALIAIGAWVMRRIAAARFGAPSRNRQPRLAIMDAAPIDTRRRLVLIRRDNVEHLLLIGGPSDVVVEQHIVRGYPVSAPQPHQPHLRQEPHPEAGHKARPKSPGKAAAAAAAAAGVAVAETAAAEPAPRPAVAEPRVAEPEMPEPDLEAALEEEFGNGLDDVSNRLEDALRHHDEPAMPAEPKPAAMAPAPEAGSKPMPKFPLRPLAGMRAARPEGEPAPRSASEPAKAAAAPSVEPPGKASPFAAPRPRPAEPGFMPRPPVPAAPDAKVPPMKAKATAPEPTVVAPEPKAAAPEVAPAMPDPIHAPEPEAPAEQPKAELAQAAGKKPSLETLEDEMAKLLGEIAGKQSS